MYLGELVEYGPADAGLRRAARAAHEGVRQWSVRMKRLRAPALRLPPRLLLPGLRVDPGQERAPEKREWRRAAREGRRGHAARAATSTWSRPRRCRTRTAAAVVVTLRNRQTQRADARADRDRRARQGREVGVPQRRAGPRAVAGRRSGRCCRARSSTGSTTRCTPTGKRATSGRRSARARRSMPRDLPRVTLTRPRLRQDPVERRRGHRLRRQPLEGRAAQARGLRRCAQGRRRWWPPAAARSSACSRASAARYSVFFIGNPKGARVALSAPPTTTRVGRRR